MTVYCITATMPDVRYCATYGEHDEACEDESCRGCDPMLATVGHLCDSCYDRAVRAVSRWPEFAKLVAASGGRLVASEGGGTTPDGYVNLSSAWMLLDAATIHLSRGGRTVDAWVESVEGAMDAVRFTRAAEVAFRRLEVEERPAAEARPQPCPECGEFAVYGNHQVKRRGVTTVTCEKCGFTLAVVRHDPADRWFGSADCESQAHAHCGSTSCPCFCHNLGAQSRPGGVQALWDADQRIPERASWVIQGPHTIEPLMDAA